MNEGKTIAWMILFGVVRAGLAWLGGWLSAHDVIDDGMLARLLSSQTAVNVTAFILSLLPLVWTVLQKMQAFAWLAKAADLIQRAKAETPSLMASEGVTPQDIIDTAKGPDFPI